MSNSMTGYGRCEIIKNGISYLVELKSVNHRYFEFSCRTPKGFAFLEEKLKSFFSKYIARGKVDVFVTVSGTASGGTVNINHAFAQKYISAVRRLKKEYKLSGRINVGDIIGNNDLFVIENESVNTEEVWDAVKQAAEGACDSFLEMRQTEGARLSDDISKRCDVILNYVSKIEAASPETVLKYCERLEQRIKELLGDIDIDKQRLLTETALFADKIAVDEETVRLRSHISQVKKLLESTEPIGRKLDFVVQEMNREANTIGSKAQDIEISQTVIAIKAEIEKIREQVQNIE